MRFMPQTYRDRQVRDWRPLAGCRSLRTLRIRQTDFAQNISTLDLTPWPALTSPSVNAHDLHPPAARTNLTSLTSHGYTSNAPNFLPLASLTNLPSLVTNGYRTVVGVGPLATTLTSLATLTLEGCDSISGFGPPAAFVRLVSLNLYGSKAATDVSGLAARMLLATLNLLYLAQFQPG